MLLPKKEMLRVYRGALTNLENDQASFICHAISRAANPVTMRLSKPEMHKFMKPLWEICKGESHRTAEVYTISGAWFRSGLRGKQKRIKILKKRIKELVEE